MMCERLADQTKEYGDERALHNKLVKGAGEGLRDSKYCDPHPALSQRERVDSSGFQVFLQSRLGAGWRYTA